MTGKSNIPYPSMIATIVIIFFTGQCVVPVDNARILAVETFGGRSHWNFVSAVLRSLTDVGHEVTVFTPFPDGDRVNYTEVDISKSLPVILDVDLIESMKGFSNPIAAMDSISALGKFSCDVIYDNSQFKDVLLGTGHLRYDVIIMEPLAVDCMSSVANTLNLPIIFTITSSMKTQVERDLTGHISNPACVSHMFASYAVPKTFAQRFMNTALLVSSTLRANYNSWLQKVTDPRPYNLSPVVAPSIVFQNSHYVTEASNPVAKNVIHIGGIHLEAEKRLPKDILDFIEDSPNGVIYFSFGSTIKLSSLPNHIINVFKEAFSRIPQRVLWKYEEDMNDLPKNVMIKKWFPQRDILLHPNVRLFISHGGMSGMYEAVDASVPVLGFPGYIDQLRNIDHLVHSGMAISMDLLSVSQHKLLNAISDLINTKKYKKNAKIASELFRDRPMSPQKSVVYWTEYVIRHKGAPHLRSHAFNINWYQYFLLDVFAVVIIIICLSVYILFKVFNTICRYTPKYLLRNKVKIQ